MSMHVAVLQGGMSREREVSLTSGKAVEAALRELGYQVSVIDAQADVAQQLVKVAPDVVFNALHGQYGEDGCVQGVLETLGIPYTHSGVLASALAMHKPMTKAVCGAAGIRSAEGGVFLLADILQHAPMDFPFVVKPINDGSSVAVHIVMDAAGFDALRGAADDLGDSVLVERYIAGREVQVAVLDDAPLGAIEIKPHAQFYDYTAKYTSGMADHLMPAPLPEKDYQEVLSLALRAHQALGCRGLTRSDFRYDDTGLGQGVFYLLEVNTQPGMTPLSLAPEIAANAGIDFTNLVQRLVQGARLDYGG